MPARSALRLSVGRTNIRVTEEGGPTDLYRAMNAAFGEIAKNFDWFCDQLEGFLPQDLKEALEPTFVKSQEYCPVDTGRLLASGYLEVEGFRGGARAVMGYGKNLDPPYAVYVHEMTRFSHAAPTRAKWLQAAVDEDYYAILQRVTDNVKARVG